MKILVVDDERLERRLVEKALTRIGHDVVLAENGVLAWQIVQEQQIRFVITDWDMPEMNGAQLIETIREEEKRGYVYTIMVTSKDTEEDVVEGLFSGADDYITKPFNPRELEARIAVGERMLNLEDNLTCTNQKLERLAMVDTLTGLMNRRAIYKFGHAELERARRESGSLSIIFLDIDKFKTINDVYGHLTGDETLKAVAQSIRERSRSYDGIGRWAGDEFLIILPSISVADAEKAAKRIVEGIAATNLALLDGTLLKTRASAGVASLARVTSAAAVLDDIIQQADEALYRAKEAGGNQVETVWL